MLRGLLFILITTSSLFANMVYHITFDNIQATENYTKEQVIQDFKSNYGIGFWDGIDPTSKRSSIDSNYNLSGKGNSFRIKYPAHKLKTAESGVDTRIPLSGTASLNTFQSDELYLSYWIRFSDNFDFERCGGKLPSLGGSDFQSRENQWKGRIMWRAGGSIQFYMELPHEEDKIKNDSLRFWGKKEYDGGSICENRFTPYLSSQGWHNIELHYKLNNQGKNDGLFEGWVDGEKGHMIVNASVFGNYRPEDGKQNNLTINSILLSSFLGGSDSTYEMSEDTYMWIDEIKVSTQRINEFHLYQPSTRNRFDTNYQRKYLNNRIQYFKLNGKTCSID